MILLCCCETSLSLTDIGSISNSIMAILTLVLAFYVFVYQRNRDKKLKQEQKDKELTQELNIESEKKANIKMQWFKDLIIEPKLEKLLNYFENLHLLKSKINSTDLTDDQKVELITFIKKEQSDLRKGLLDVLEHIDYELHSNLSNKLDDLTDALTDAFSNDELKLNNPKTYDREVKKRISETHDYILSNIFKYNGKTP